MFLFFNDGGFGGDTSVVVIVIVSEVEIDDEMVGSFEFAFAFSFVLEERLLLVSFDDCFA